MIFVFTLQPGSFYSSKLIEEAVKISMSLDSASNSDSDEPDGLKLSQPGNIAEDSGVFSARPEDFSSVNTKGEILLGPTGDQLDLDQSSGFLESAFVSKNNPPSSPPYVNASSAFVSKNNPPSSPPYVNASSAFVSKNNPPSSPPYVNASSWSNIPDGFEKHVVSLEKKTSDALGISVIPCGESLKGLFKVSNYSVSFLPSVCFRLLHSFLPSLHQLSIINYPLSTIHLFSRYAAYYRAVSATKLEIFLWEIVLSR